MTSSHAWGDTAVIAAPDNRVHDWIPYITVFVAGLAWMVSLWLRSPGIPVQDEIGHFLIARNAWNYPLLVLDIWGRVGHTLIYMVPSLVGLDGARLASVLMSCAIVLITTRVAYELGVRHIFLVPLFLWFQPWYGDLMYTAITEVPFSLLLILAVHEGMKERLGTASLAFGILPLVRHEGIALLGLWCLYLVVRREWRAVLIGVIPTFLYNAVYLVALHPPLLELPVFIYFKPTVSFDYGSGGWFHYMHSISWVGKVVLFWAIVGLVPAWRLGRQTLYLVPYAVYFALHMVIYRMGAYGSGGYYLFILPTAPVFAILAALGADTLLNHAQAAVAHLTRVWSRRVAITVLAALLLVPVIYSGLKVKPRPLNPEDVVIQQAAKWLRTQRVSPSAVVTTHVCFYYFYRLPWTPQQVWYLPPPVAQMPHGTVAVWDMHYSDRWGMQRNSFREDKGWHELARFGSGQVVVFQRLEPDAELRGEKESRVSKD